MKYIDADRLRAEIEQLLEFDGTVKTDYYIGKRDAELVILSFLDSLQQKLPEVNLEKEVEKYLLDNADFVTKSTSNEMVNALARHFAEWGAEHFKR